MKYCAVLRLSGFLLLLLGECWMRRIGCILAVMVLSTFVGCFPKRRNSRMGESYVS
jgi:hypothetical protein